MMFETNTEYRELSYCICICTIFHRYPIFSKSYTGYRGTSEVEHGLYTCTVDNPLAKARELSLCTGAQTMLKLIMRIYM